MLIADPLVALAVILIVALRLPAVTLVMVGAAGVVAGVTDCGADAALLPAELIAFSFTEYVAPFVKFDTIIGLVVEAESPIVVSRLATGSTYSVQIKAINAKGVSVASNAVSVTL